MSVCFEASGSYGECINEELSTNLQVCIYQMDLLCTSMQILNEVISVQIQTRKQVK